MIHLWMNGIEVESWYHHHPDKEYDLAHADAQNWANEYGESVELWGYEGHETIEDGEFIETVQPQPLQLGLVPGTDVVVVTRGMTMPKTKDIRQVPVTWDSRMEADSILIPWGCSSTRRLPAPPPTG